MLTMRLLLEAHGSPMVDVLQIDAEGFDYKILRQWDFSASTPSIVNLEHARLAAEEKSLAVELLLSQGYVLYRRGLDVTAFRSEMLDF